jgi:3-dehydroquinate synthase
METKIVTIDLDERGYDIYIGSGLRAHIEDFLPQSVKGRKVFVVTDNNVEAYARDIAAQIHKAGAVLSEVFVLPAGEATKSYQHLQQIHDWMLENSIHRTSLILAVGGGVIGDLAGFAAATIMRGVPFVQVPTTLLAQVDSSVGGKTGINTAHGKNLIGSFYQPIGVIADLDSLKTLPKRQILAGYAEIVKYGLIADYAFFEWLEERGADVIALDPYALSYAIEKSCRAKAHIVQADEREGGMRALLNFGHTFGHALEAAAGYDGTLLHGEAVSIGMVMAFDLSVRMGLCEDDDLHRVRAHLQSVGLPVVLDTQKIKTTVEDLIATMRRDKKATDTKMTFILASTIGETFVTQNVLEENVKSVLRDYIA